MENERKPRNLNDKFVTANPVDWSEIEANILRMVCAAMIGFAIVLSAVIIGVAA